jgi:rhodanese-related sulfurtransferase
MNITTRRFSTMLVVFSAATGLVSAACAAEPSDTEVSQTQVTAWIEGGTGPLLLDVRSENEFASGHVPGAVNIPHNQLGARLNEIGGGREQSIVVYCESGRRAGIAASTLQEAGFSSIQHLIGDMSAWRDAGLPTESEPSRLEIGEKP